MNARFSRAARGELRAAVWYYDEQRPGLGAEFVDEVEATIERIKQFPEAWHPLSQRSRRCRTRRFPYGVIYQVKSDHILIVAVADLRRDPQHWNDRL